MRRSVIVGSIVAVVAGALVGSAGPPAAAHAGHQISIVNTSATEGTIQGQAPELKTMTISISPAPESGEEITVQWSTSEMPGQAEQAELLPVPEPTTFPRDYQEAFGTVSFSSGEASEAISIPVTRDGADEDDETFKVILGNALCASGLGCTVSIADGEGIFLIQDDDPTPSFSIAEPTPAPPVEGNINQTFFEFEVARTGGSEHNTTVNFSTADGTATDADNDYEPTGGTLIFPAGNGGGDPQVVTVMVNGDTKPEPNETFFVNLSNPTNATIGDGSAQGNINNDDGPVPPSMTIGDAQPVFEGSQMLFTISLSQPPGNGNDMTVNYSTQPGSAVPPDFTAESGSVTFQNLETTKQIDIATFDDSNDEPHETMSVVISKPVPPPPCCSPGTDYQITDASGQGTILDDDSGVAVHDFNNDGFDDVAIGAHGDDVNNVKNAGSVNVLYGRASGLGTGPVGDQLWHAGVGTVQGDLGTNHLFGASLAVGDLNGDGFSDLAIGVPGASGSAGAVNVLYGSASGLTTNGNQRWTQNSSGIADDEESGDALGTSVAIFDINGDTRSDLIVGAPGEAIGTGNPAGAGAVHVLYGTASGLSATGSQIWSQGSDGVPETAEIGDAYGRAVAAGDVNGDSFGDVIIGAPTEDLAGADAGAATVLYGTFSGLSAAGSELLVQGVDGVDDAAEAGDQFAASLATGDMNGDNRDDVAIGVPLENLNGTADAGAVNVIYGGLGGLVPSTTDQFWSQDSTVGLVGVREVAEAGDRAGSALVAKDFDGDGRDDLALGVPREDFKRAGVTRTDAGVANVLYGSAGSGLVATDNQLWHLDVAGVLGNSANGDFFGGTTSAGDFNGDGEFDVVFGVFAKDLSTAKKNAGAASVLYGSSSNLTAVGDDFWHRDVNNVDGVAQKGDVFSGALG